MDDLNSVANSSSPSQKEITRQPSAEKVDASRKELEETWCVCRAMPEETVPESNAGKCKEESPPQ